MPTTRNMKAAGVTAEDIAEAATKNPKKQPLLETENYTQMPEYTYKGLKIDFAYKSISFGGRKFVFLESKKVKGRRCLFSNVDKTILVFENKEKNWKAEADPEDILFWRGEAEVDPEVYSGPNTLGYFKCYDVDIDAYMQGIMNLEFEDNSGGEWVANHMTYNSEYADRFE